jgi:hypothetical protein
MRKVKPQNSFRETVLQTLELQHALQEGLQALAKTDRQRLTCNTPNKIAGSVNLEQALRLRHPNEPIWDYGVGLRSAQNSDHVKWIEVHPASSSHVDEVLKKLVWLRSWLRHSAPALEALPREFVWVALGKVALQKGSPQMRRIAQAGLRFAGERFVLAI